MNEEMREVWKAILEVYKAFAQVCESQGLRYYVAYGTCLGAVRHHGFIPWDDDFDVIMPRNDYERFREIQRANLPPCFKYVDWHNTREMASFTYAKIQECRRDIVADVEAKCGRELPHGIYIDIFPLDGAPRFRLSRWIWEVRLRLLRLAGASLVVRPQYALTLRRKIGRIVGRSFNRFIFHASVQSDLARYYDAMVREKPFSPSFPCGCIITSYGSFYGLCDYSVYGEPSMVAFEGLKVPVPHDVDTYLRTLYGDYMQLPPMEKRISCHKALETAPWKFGPTDTDDASH